MAEETASAAFDDDQLNNAIQNSDWNRAELIFIAHPEAAESIYLRLGWTKLHWLCSIGSTPASLIEVVARINPLAITLPDRRFLDSPLHLAGRNCQVSAVKLEALLSYVEDPQAVLVRNQFGGTPLHSAANHNAVIGALQVLVDANPRILTITTHEGLHAIAALWHSYIQTIPGYMSVAKILKGESIEDAHFARFWNKAMYLATAYYRVVVDPTEQGDDCALHGMLKCNVALNMFKVALAFHPILAAAVDINGNLPLHRLLRDRPYRLKEREAIQALLDKYPQATSVVNDEGQVPLTIALLHKIPWANGVDALIAVDSSAASWRDPHTGLYPFQLAASIGGKVALETTYHLLLTQPDLIQRH